GYSEVTVPDRAKYREVSSDQTGHAENIKVKYDQTVITYEELLFIFKTIHDPTTLNRQRANFASQYRSVIYYHNNEQKEVAEKIIKQLAPHFDRPITTELSPADAFFPAEDYHQDRSEERRVGKECVSRRSRC